MEPNDRQEYERLWLASEKLYIIKSLIKYYEIVLILSPIIVKNVKDYDSPAQIYMPITNMNEVFLRALK
jgi:hypothetical protein